jgi:hypothetical protein
MVFSAFWERGISGHSRYNKSGCLKILFDDLVMESDCEGCLVMSPLARTDVSDIPA